MELEVRFENIKIAHERKHSRVQSVITAHSLDFHAQ